MHRSLTKRALVAIAAWLVAPTGLLAEEWTQPDLAARDFIFVSPLKLDSDAPAFAMITVAFKVVNQGKQRVEGFEVDVGRCSQLGGRPLYGGVLKYHGVCGTADGDQARFEGDNPLPGGTVLIPTPLEPGAAAVCEAVVAIPLGPVKHIFLWIEADALDQVEEEDESNNTSDRLPLTLP